MSSVDCRIAELNDHNNCSELPTSDHSYYAEVAREHRISLNPPKRASHTSRKVMHEHLEPITTPKSTPYYTANQLFQIAPGMTLEDISPVSSEQSPLTPSSIATSNTRRQSSFHYGIPPLTRHQMPQPAISQDVQVSPASDHFQNYPYRMEPESHQRTMRTSFHTASSTAGFVYGSDTAGLPQTCFLSSNGAPEYSRPSHDLPPYIYPPSPHIQGGSNLCDKTARYYEYESSPRTFNHAYNSYYNVNVGQWTSSASAYPLDENKAKCNVPDISTACESGKVLSIACEMCGAMFNGRYVGTNMKTVHNANRPTEDRTCSFCHRVFNRNDAARKHERNAHPLG